MLVKYGSKLLHLCQKRSDHKTITMIPGVSFIKVLLEFLKTPLLSNHDQINTVITASIN
jgi:hypothetical protein